MALEAGGSITIKGKALTTKVSKAWAQSKFGQAWQEANIEGAVVKVNSKTVKVDLGDGFMVEVKKSAAAGDPDVAQADAPAAMPNGAPAAGAPVVRRRVTNDAAIAASAAPAAGAPVVRRSSLAAAAPAAAPPTPAPAAAAGGGDSDSEENRAQAAAAAAADADSDSDSDEEGHVGSDDDEEAPAAAAAAGAGGAAAPDLDSVTMTNKAGSYSVEWNKVGSIRVDARTGPRFKPAMLWPPDVKGREEDDFFFHFFPRDMVGCITGWSNEARCADAEDAKTKPITQCEIVMALGYLVAAASGNVSVKMELFRTTSADVDGEEGGEGEEDRLFPGPSFGSRFGMSKHRFFFVLRWMRFFFVLQCNRQESGPLRHEVRAARHQRVPAGERVDHIGRIRGVIKEQGSTMNAPRPVACRYPAVTLNLKTVPR
jgi:hypothetical protein